ncbi:MAG: Copper resistance protein precursor [Phenylobacterium sp.]|jgi:methionine-rich copper-binding protein CopC|nr:Copper resistance protein precursor [Phenylobacterium sp.]
MRKTLILAAALSLIGAVQADAHARLLKSDPKAGATVAAPKVLRLSYSETIVPGNSSVSVTGPDKAPVATGPIALDAKDKRTVLAPVTGKLAPGAYKLDWSMTSADGHTMTGAFVFKVK